MNNVVSRYEKQTSSDSSSGPIIQELDNEPGQEMTGVQLSQLLNNLPPGTAQEVTISTAPSDQLFKVH